MELPDDLKTSIQSGRCVAFIGSGLSAGVYGPNGRWSHLVNGLCRHCGVSEEVDNDSPADKLLKMAQSALDTDGSAYYDYLGSVFGCPQTNTNMLYGILLSLPFKCFLTLNFDPLLYLQWRRTDGASQDKFHIYPNLDREGMNCKSIHYLHGYIPEGGRPSANTIVFAQSEFDHAYRPNSQLNNLLIPTFANDPVVFVGCRLREPAMSRVFKICEEQQQERMGIVQTRGITTNSPPIKFILLPEPDDPKIVVRDKEYYGDLGITACWYPAPDNNHAALRLAFEQLADLPKFSAEYGWGVSPIVA